MTDAHTCPRCNKRVDPVDQFCPYCGAPIPPPAPRKILSGGTELMVPLPVDAETSPTVPVQPATTSARRSRMALVGWVAALALVLALGWLVTTRRAASPPEAEPPRAVSREGPGRIVLTGVPFGATITIDGQRQDGASFELPPGVHIIRVSAVGYPTRADTVQLEPGQLVEVPFSRPPAGR